MNIKCPKCGSITTIRTRNKDGRKFYVCVRYPKCKGKVEQEWDEERVVDSQEEQPKKSGVKPSRSKKPAKSLKKWYVILGVIAVALVVVLVVLLLPDRGTETSPTSNPTYDYTVKYRVFGEDDRAWSVVVGNETGGLEYFDNVSLPASYTYYHVPIYTRLSVMAGNRNDPYAEITVEIILDGVVVAEHTNEGWSSAVYFAR